MAINKFPIGRSKTIIAVNSVSDQRISSFDLASGIENRNTPFPSRKGLKLWRKLKKTVKAIKSRRDLNFNLGADSQATIPNDLDEQVDILIHFSESAGYLNESSFFKSMLVKGTTATFQPSFNPDVEDIAFFKGPNEDSFRSSILMLRFFLERNEATQVDKISQLIQAFPHASDMQKEEFDQLCTSFKSVYAESEFKGELAGAGEPTTKDVIFQTFLYGAYAHAKTEKRNRLKCWAGNAESFTFRQQEFVDQVFKLISWLGNMKQLVDQLLQAYSDSIESSE